MTPSLSFFTSPKKVKSKTLLFFTFYITTIIFYYYSNKKKPLQNKTFHFPIKQFQTFLYIISHQLLFTTIQTKIPQHNYLPNTPNVTNK
jgi:hypothetical protein